MPLFFKLPKLRLWTQWILTIVLIISTLLGAVRLNDKHLVDQNFPYRNPDSVYIPKEYIRTISFLKDAATRQEYFITLTSEASWYYFVGVPSPTRFGIIWFASPTKYQQEVIEDLEKDHIKYILYSNSYWSNIIDGISNRTRLPLLYEYIDTHYTRYVVIDGNEIWIKN